MFVSALMCMPLNEYFCGEAAVSAISALGPKWINSPDSGNIPLEKKGGDDLSVFGATFIACEGIDASGGCGAASL